MGLADAQFENANYKAALASARRRDPAEIRRLQALRAGRARPHEARRVPKAVEAYTDAARIAPYDSAIQEYIVKARSKMGSTPRARLHPLSRDPIDAGSASGSPSTSGASAPVSSTGTPSR